MEDNATSIYRNVGAFLVPLKNFFSKPLSFATSQGYLVGGGFLMDEEKKRDPKREKEDIVRFCNFVIQMVEIYGAEILAEDEEERKRAEES